MKKEKKREEENEKKREGKEGRETRQEVWSLVDGCIWFFFLLLLT